MRTRVSCRVWLRSVLSGLVCLWLGLGPVVAASSLWESAPDCCCGSGSVCLLGGCDCGGQKTRESSPCGGLRSAEDFGGNVTVLSYSLHLGLVSPGISESRVESVGQVPMDDDSMLELVVRSLEPPPPRFAAAR